MKEVLDFRDFCKKNELSELSPQSLNKYQLYTEECRKTNSTFINDAIQKAKEKLSK